ncbi:MAG: glutamate-1-semialdehyde 2,1-aminomutase [Chitinivibrionales bacterium]|nr:glutamate-1-semialdehyde 2,1-aminomutase [Chitinivibrionales bacterium]MBD3358927.1 glutamate-1-semialdehyde 2,1-aminomutase [Chitinivibrionales bacterium]
MNNLNKSAHAFQKARGLIPGGVNSPVRAFAAVGGTPPFIVSGRGARIVDTDGNEYLDFVGSWGPLILGHAHSAVVKAVQQAASQGTSFGAPTEAETELAELMVAMVPSVEMVRLVNSGTEATMSAVRLARGFTGRELIVKFEGCYHGHGDGFLIAAGSGAATLGVPNSPGVTAGTAKDTLLATYNNSSSVQHLFDTYGGSIAAVVVEPVAGNMGVVPPAPGFLESIRELTSRHGSLLIFDEVMTGFRLAPGGAQERYGVTPDLSTFGKVIGGGLPVGAYGGRRDIMLKVAPTGPIYQAGTLSGNPLATAAGLATLHTIRNDPGFYEKLERKADRLAAGLSESIEVAGIPAFINRVGSMMTLFFNESGPVTDYTSASKSDTARYARYFGACLEQGVYLAPSQFEAAFVSSAHTDDDIERTIELSRQAMSGL